MLLSAYLDSMLDVLVLQSSAYTDDSVYLYHYLRIDIWSYWNTKLAYIENTLTGNPK